MQPISRAECIDIIFDLGEEYDHALSTIVRAVMTCDRYGQRAGYSIELAHAALVLTVKLLEDSGYRVTAHTLAYCQRTVLRIEWELIDCLPNNDFVTLYHQYSGRVPASELCYRACVSEHFPRWSTAALVMAVALLTNTWHDRSDRH